MFNDKTLLLNQKQDKDTHCQHCCETLFWQYWRMQSDQKNKYVNIVKKEITYYSQMAYDPLKNQEIWLKKINNNKKTQKNGILQIGHF